MNPMYSTCIGLILRGYHDHENGKMRFVGDGGNMIHIALDEAIPAIKVDDTLSKVPTDEEAAAELEQHVNQKHEKRNETMRRLFDSLKGKFMSLFEEAEDKEM